MAVCYRHKLFEWRAEVLVEGRHGEGKGREVKSGEVEGKV